MKNIYEICSRDWRFKGKRVEANIFFKIKLRETNKKSYNFSIRQNGGVHRNDLKEMHHNIYILTSVLELNGDGGG